MRMMRIMRRIMRRIMWRIMRRIMRMMRMRMNAIRILCVLAIVTSIEFAIISWYDY
jgi:hypothetical protein